MGCKFDGISFPEAIYKYVRTAIVHEGELDARLKLVEPGKFRIGELWELPESIVPALILAVIVARESRAERTSVPVFVTVLGARQEVSSLWGQEDMIRALLASATKGLLEWPSRS